MAEGTGEPGSRKCLCVGGRGRITATGRKEIITRIAMTTTIDKAILSSYMLVIILNIE